MKKIIKCVLFFLATFVLLYGQALAYLMTNNQRLDHAIYAKHDPKLIIAGRIVRKDVKPRPPAVESYPADVSFRFEVTSVILGKQAYKGQILTIPATSFMWPDNLVSFKTGSRCILVLHTNWGEKRDGYYIVTVVPANRETLPTAKDNEEAKRILAQEIISELKTEASESRQRELIMQVSPILTAKESGALLPFLKTKNVWLRRTALAGLVYATKDQNFLQMAHDDIEQFIKTTDALSIINDFEKRIKYDPFALLFSHYFFLSVGWDVEEDIAASAFLPLFRLIAHSSLTEWLRWEHGVRPLCRAGNKTDAAFLYHYLRDRQGEQKKEVFKFSSHRQEIIMGISRIMNMNLSNWVESDFLKKEVEQQRQITETLIKEKIIDEKDR